MKPPPLPPEPKSEQVTVPYNGGLITGDREHIGRFIESIEKQKALRARWQADTREAITVLCKKSPTLRDADGIEPRGVGKFIEWLNGPGSGVSLAGRFGLGMWNGETDWTEEGLGAPGMFDVYRAIGVWDEELRVAFLSWVIAPFWP